MKITDESIQNFVKQLLARSKEPWKIENPDNKREHWLSTKLMIVKIRPGGGLIQNFSLGVREIDGADFTTIFDLNAAKINSELRELLLTLVSEIQRFNVKDLFEVAFAEANKLPTM